MSDILLQAHDLSVQFGGVRAVNQVSFAVCKGEVFTLIGPNGAGKTTVFNLISRIYNPTSGHIRWHTPTGELTLTDCLAHKVAGLPYGVRKVVELARALCTEPQLLLLDEPSSGLNAEETDDMAYWIRDIQHELGITVLMVEHDMRLVSMVSDRVLAMNQGQVLALGSPAEVQSHPDVVEAYLGSAEDLSHLRRSRT